MTLSQSAFLIFVFLAFSTTGCLTQRTIRDGDHVVAQGYVVKPPLAPLTAQ